MQAFLLFAAALFSAPQTPFPGLPQMRGIVFDAKGALFGATGDKVVQVLGPRLVQTLASTGGAPAGIAAAPDGDLYVADPGRRAVLRVRPWGEVTEAYSMCGGKALTGPGDVALTPDGVLYTDAGRICRGSEEVAQLKGVSALAASDKTLYAAASDGSLWRIDAKPSRIGSIGEPATGLAVDGRGNLLVSALTGVHVVSPVGRLLARVALPGAADVAIGAADPSAFFVPASGAIHRDQGAAVAPGPAFEILEPFDGAVLNRHDGELTPEGLRITVRGRSARPVRVNGKPAAIRKGEFTASVVLRARETRIAAESGGKRRQITVLWDKDSFPRYRVSVDDNIYWLKDIATHGYASIFENPYLKTWRELHRKYGIKVHFNIYYETAGFNLAQMPDRYRSEWRANADWIRFSFHARANNPDRPYLHSTAERIRQDHRLVTREIERFAGKELLSPVTTIHWGSTTSAAVEALRAEGVKTLAGYFELRTELPAVSYDLPMPIVLHLSGRDYWKDNRRDILFVRHDIVLNSVDLKDIVPHLEKLTPHQSEVLELMIHEQHFYPDFKAGYRPDYFDRIEAAVRWASERGYKPVFFGDGFCGAPAPSQQ